jgi:hypothetical protein
MDDQGERAGLRGEETVWINQLKLVQSWLKSNEGKLNIPSHHHTDSPDTVLLDRWRVRAIFAAERGGERRPRYVDGACVRL